MEDPIVLPPSIEDIPPPGLALVEELDKLLLVQVPLPPPPLPPRRRLLAAQRRSRSPAFMRSMQRTLGAVERWAQDHWHPSLLRPVCQPGAVGCAPVQIGLQVETGLQADHASGALPARHTSK